MSNEEILEYAADYQAFRSQRGKKLGGIFPPMELLRSNATDELHLSVSFSGTGFSDLYLSQRVTRFRAARIKMRWLIIPGTISCVLDRDGFLANFEELTATVDVDGETFWIIPEDRESALRQKIRLLRLDNSFRQEYQHAYLPDHPGAP